MSKFRIPSIPIRYAIPGIIALLIIIAVGLTTMLSYNSGQSSANDTAVNLSRQVAERIQERVYTFVETPQKFLEMNRAAVNSGELDLTDFDEMRVFFWNQIYIYNSVPYIYFANPDGDFIGIDTSFDGGGAVFKLRDVEISTDRMTYTVDNAGNPVELVEAKGYDPVGRPWYTDAVGKGQPTWADVYTTSARRELSITPVMPVYNETGNLEGVFGINITLNELTDFLRSLEITENGKAYIIELDGNMIATSSSEDPFVMNDQSEQERLDVRESTDEIIRASALELLGRYSDFASIPFSEDVDGLPLPVQFEFPYDGEIHLGQVASVADNRGLNWLVVVVIPENDFMAQTHANISNTLVLGLLVLVAAAILGFLLSSRIIRPMDTVMQVSSSIEKEEFMLDPLENIVTREDELGQLARVIKSMASQVYIRETEMKQQLAELRIEIDEVKRKKQVDDIVDTDFFRELQEKALEIRRKAGKA